MSSLHIVNVAADHPRLAECLVSVEPADTLLLIEDAVMALPDRSLTWPEGVSLRALTPDLQARGLSRESLPTGVTPISYEEFVTLTLESDKVICW